MYFQKTNIKEIEQEIVTLSKKLGVPEFNPNIHYSDLDLVKYEADIRSEIEYKRTVQVDAILAPIMVAFALQIINMASSSKMFGEAHPLKEWSLYGKVIMIVITGIVGVAVFVSMRILDKLDVIIDTVFRKRISELHRLADYIKIYRENR